CRRVLLHIGVCARGGLRGRTGDSAIPLHLYSWDPCPSPGLGDSPVIGRGVWLADRDWQWEQGIVAVRQPVAVAGLWHWRSASTGRVRPVAQSGGQGLLDARRPGQPRCDAALWGGAPDWHLGERLPQGPSA